MYKQIMPATDWFYVDFVKAENTITLYPLAAWALTDDIKVIGLISVPGTQQVTEDPIARLVSVPPSTSGHYKHREELSQNEITALKNNGYLKLGS